MLAITYSPPKHKSMKIKHGNDRKATTVANDGIVSLVTSAPHTGSDQLGGIPLASVEVR